MASPGAVTSALRIPDEASHNMTTSENRETDFLYIVFLLQNTK
jgi:hypothetical protein